MTDQHPPRVLAVIPARGGSKGLPFETVASLKNVMQLTKLDKDHALILVKGDGGMNLETIELP